MSGNPPVDVIAVTSDEADERSERIVQRAFGHAFDPKAYARRKPVRREGHFFLARHDGTDAGTGGAYEYAMSLPGGGEVPVWGISGVGVRPDHRRRGVLTRLMATLLDEAADRGMVAAVLYASEAVIYPRFGFGMSAPRAHARMVAGRGRLRPEAPVAAGRVRAEDPGADWLAALDAVYTAVRERRPGELSRSATAWQAMLQRRDDSDDRLMLIREDAAGEPDGYAIYTITDNWRGSGPEHELQVHELVARSDGAELALWQALSEHDLVSVVSAEVPVDWLVPAAVVDPWSVRTRSYPDGMWARLLDVPRALAQRRYRCPGRLVLRVLDEGRASVAGTFLLSVDAAGTALCEATRNEPDLVLASDVLAELWLGAGSAARLVRVGRMHEPEPGAATLADLMFGWDPAPFTTQHF